MNILQTIILSVIEGVTEFLPVSSTGHLIIGAKILGLAPTEFLSSFEIFIQTGAIFAVVIYSLPKLLKNRLLWKNILYSFIPTAILGLVMYKVIKHYLLGSLTVTLINLIIGGVIFIILEKFILKKNKNNSTINNLTVGKSMVIGSIQALSFMPGVSRAAATIYGGLFAGLSRLEAVEYSFYLSIPTMLAATVLDLKESQLNFTMNEIILFLVGFLGSFVVAFISIKFFLSYIKKNNFIAFGIYRIIIGILLLLFLK